MELKSFNSSCCSSTSIDNIRKISAIGAPPSFLMENDDEKDKNIRRKSRIRSIPNIISEPVNVSKDQLRDIYSTCIKLSTENKISSKNAFGLQLIDYMQEVLQQHKEEHGTNFQVASCTLDASVKIYGYRVDSVHLDTFRMAGTLGHGVEQKDVDEQENSHDGDTNEEGKLNSKQRRAAKTHEKDSHSKIENNLKNIQLDKIEVEEESNLWNVIFARKPISSAFGRSGPDAYILNNYNISSDYGYICIDPFSKPIDNPVLINVENTIELPQEKLQVFTKYNDESTNQVKFVEQLHHFSFNSWEQPEKRQTLSGNLLSLILKNNQIKDEDSIGRKEESGLSQIKPFIPSQENIDNFNDSFDGPEDNDVNVSLHDAHVDLSQKENTQRLKIGSQEGININTNPFCNELSTQPGEYSYFVNAYDPTSLVKKEMANFNISKMNLLSKLKVTRQLVSHERKRKAGNKKAQHSINFNEELTREDKKCLASSHTKKVLTNVHKSENINQSTMGVSNIINEDVLSSLFLIPFTVLSVDIFEKLQKNSQLPMVSNTGFSNNAPINENGNALGEDDYDDAFDDVGENKPDKDFAENSFLNNLVPQPLTVNRLFIKYAKVSKKLDTRAVKVAMWKLLENDNKSAKSEPEPDTQSNQETQLVFNNVYKKLPSQLSKTVSENLSPQLAFVCLLHLANEKNLVLKNSDDYKSIYIDITNSNT